MASLTTPPVFLVKNSLLQPGSGNQNGLEGCNPLIFIRNQESEKSGNKKVRNFNNSGH